MKKYIALFILFALYVPSAFAQLAPPTAPTEPVEEVEEVEEVVTPPADTTAPLFLSVATAGALEDEVTVVWATDEPAYGYVEYGSTTGYGKRTAESTTLALAYTVPVTGLVPGTTYHYRIVARDGAGNVRYSKDRLFETEIEFVATDSVPPVVSNVSISKLTTSGATINWNTDELAQGRVEYGTTNAYGKVTAFTPDYAAEHALTLSSLTASTTYHYRIRAEDESGNTRLSIDRTFTTKKPVPTVAEPEEETTQEPEPAPEPEPELEPIVEPEPEPEPAPESPAILPPEISEMRSAVGTSTAHITFTTDTPAQGLVRYSKTTSYGRSDGGHTTLLTAHSHTLTNLAPDTTYHYIVLVQDAFGNETIYEDQTFRTQAATTSPRPIEPLPVTDTDETVTDETSEPEGNFGRSSGGGGGVHAYAWTPTLTAPRLTKVQGLDGQVMFVWKPLALPKVARGSTQIRSNIVIVRNPVRFSESPQFGKIVYRGNSGLFVDTHVENGVSYHYSVFTINQFKSHSRPTRLLVTPRAKDVEVKIAAVPAPVRDPAQIFDIALHRDLKRGDTGADVAILQQFLVNAESYAAGLVTGYFGPLTQAAVRTFQRAHDIKPASGNFGPLSKQMMLKVIRNRPVSL